MEREKSRVEEVKVSEKASVREGMIKGDFVCVCVRERDRERERDVAFLSVE
jgi:hypothetical protein